MTAREAAEATVVLGESPAPPVRVAANVTVALGESLAPPVSAILVLMGKGTKVNAVIFR